MPEAIRTSTETNATFEKRGTVTVRPATRFTGRQGRPDDQQADEPAEPDRAGDEVEPVEQQREAARRGLARVARRAREDEHGGRGGKSAREVATSSAIERCSRLGRSTQTAIHEATQNSAKQISMST